MTDTKDGAPLYTAKDRAHKYPQWQINDHKTICALVVDIDRDDWVIPFWETIGENPDLMPSWVIEKASNNHGQLGWLIEHMATGENAPDHPIRYANAVRYALTQAFGGDENFVNSRCWNPTWDGWNKNAGDVTWGIIEPRPLGTFYKALQRAGLWVTNEHNRRPTVVNPLSKAPGRNCHIFDVARLRNRGSVAEAAHAANDALPIPLSPAELGGIIRSIERWEAVHGAPWDRRGAHSMKGVSEEERQRQRERGRRGGLAGSEKQQAARAQGPQAAAIIRSAEAVGRAATALALQQEGFTRSQIAKQMNAHPGSVKRWLRQARELDN